MQAPGADLVSEGYFTATVTVWDSDPATADEKRRLVEPRALRGIRAQTFAGIRCQAMATVRNGLL